MANRLVLYDPMQNFMKLATPLCRILPVILRCFLLGTVVPGGVRAQSIESPRLRVSVGADGAMEVVDKTAGVTWSQPGGKVRVSGARSEGGTLAFTINGRLKATVALRGADIEFALHAPPDDSIEGLEYPAGFTLAQTENAQRLLLPNCAGLAIPFAERHTPALRPAIGLYDACISQRGLTMPWIGVDAGKVGTLMLIETPYDAQMRVSTDAAGYHYAVVWQDSKGRAAYERKVRWHFAAEGGMVALCKYYRACAQADGLLVTLREKRRALPALDRFVGAMSLWVTDWPDLELVEKMKTGGLRRLLFSFHVSEKVPAGKVARPGHNLTYEAIGREFAWQLHQQGLLAGRYDYYRTIFPPTDTGAGGNQWIMRSVGYPEQLAIDEKGRVRAGFDAQRGRVGELIRGHRCSKCQFEMAQAYIPLDVDRVGYDARLLDAVCAVPWQECYSLAHPVTRTEDMQYRYKQLEVATANGQITGTEHMSSWAVPVSCYGEGPTTFVRFFRTATPANARLKPGVPLEMPDEYRQVVLNERLRAPLWQLVFHDAVVITNRWNITANRYTNPRDWDQEDLLNLLHGQMPTMLLNRENYEANAARLAKTFETVCEWNQQVGYEEMTDFRWLTPDGSVQRSAYASGHAVTVNFGDTPFQDKEGRSVPARGYVVSGAK